MLDKDTFCSLLFKRKTCPNMFPEESIINQEAKYLSWEFFTVSASYTIYILHAGGQNTAFI